ncbi:MAG: 50S ribosomal protein L16 [Bacilli bacterium]|jgi:large subunit ribosomal protein L16|nr:50S ribosomal protein L16 [Bacilli bacterium]
MLIPSRTKYRRVHRLPYEGKARGNTELKFGDYGLQAKEGAWITNNQIEAARVAMTRYMKRGGKVWTNIFPHMPLTKKPIGTRQGKGKGNVEAWVAVVKEGKIMFEVSGVDEAVAREALRLASHKLPITCRFVKRENGGESNEG